MAKIFFSYAREDKDLVLKVRDKFRDAGHEVWLDEEISIGIPFPQAIEIALSSCDYFAVFMSQNSTRDKSPWVAVETQIYLLKDIENNNNTILPFKIDSTDIKEFSLFLTRLNIYDLNKDFDTSTTNAIKSIENFLGPIVATDMQDYDRLFYAIDMVITAGHTSMMYYNSGLKINAVLDSTQNPATQADQAAYLKIEPLIRIRYGDDKIVAEEKDKQAKALRVNEQGYTWIIDSLDGTTNFTNRIDFFCSAIGILKNKEPIIGAIYDPINNEVYFGMKGLRSQVWRVNSGEVTKISTTPNITELKDAIIGSHISSRQKVAQQMFKNNHLEKLSLHFRQIRLFGSGQLALAYLAAGRLHAFMQFDSYIWDQVAGVVIVQNAGGVIKELRGEKLTVSDWNYNTKTILACANERILDGFCAHIIGSGSGSASAPKRGKRRQP